MSPDPSPDSTRRLEHSIEIDAPADAVWKALTDAEALKRWFPLDARVRPGKGGSIWLSWGPPFEHESPIVAWEPNRHLGWIEERPPCDPDAPGGFAGEPARLAIDFHLETRGGKTILRVVNSGFGHGASWDDELDATVQGWHWCFLSLRHSLERHSGKPRAATWVFATPPLDRAATWARLTAPAGFALASGSFASLRPGDRFTMSAGALRVEGRVLLCRADHVFLATLETLGDGLIFFELNLLAGKSTIGVMLSTYGEPTAPARAAHASVRELFSRLFPAS